MVKSFSVFSQSIRRKIVGVALGLIILMMVTSALSIVMSAQVGHLLDELTNRYIPAYGNLARANVRSLERALALRRMVIAKMQTPPDEEGYKTRLESFRAKDGEVEKETDAARKLINEIIADKSTPSDNAALARIETRIEIAVTDLRRELAAEDDKLLKALDAGKFEEARNVLAHVDTLRDTFVGKLEAIRATVHERRARTHDRMGANAAASRRTPKVRRCSASCRAASTTSCAPARRPRSRALGFDGYALGGLAVGERIADSIHARRSRAGCRATGRAT